MMFKISKLLFIQLTSHVELFLETFWENLIHVKLHVKGKRKNRNIAKKNSFLFWSLEKRARNDV